MRGGPLPQRIERFERMLAAASAFCARRPVFTAQELDVALGVCSAEWRGRRQRVVQRLIDRGALCRLTRHTFAVVERRSYGVGVPDGAGIGSTGRSGRPSFAWDRTLAYAVVGRMKPDAILGLRTALEVHGALLPIEGRPFFFLTCSQHECRRVWGDIVGVGIRHAERLRRAGRWRIGVSVVMCGEMPVRVTTRERTFVDVLDHGRLAGTLTEVVGGALRLVTAGSFDWTQLVAYVRAVGRRSTAARVGWLLEAMRESRGVMVPEEALVALKTMRPLGPTYWDWVDRVRQGSGGQYSRPWRLVVPASVIESVRGTSPSGQRVTTSVQRRASVDARCDAL